MQRAPAVNDKLEIKRELVKWSHAVGEGVRLVVLVLNQQDALQPHHAPALMSGKLSI